MAYPSRTPSELQVHIATVFFIRQYLRPTWRHWHTPNGELRDRRLAAKLKAMGTLAGVPDLLIVSPDGRLHCLEFKRPGARLSPAQEAFQAFCIEHGIPFVVATSVDEAIAALRAWDCLVRLPPSEVQAW